MTINEMVKGQKYLIGDSLGYDLVVCISAPEQTEYQGSYGTMVKYREILGEEMGEEQILFETPNCGFTTYVEPR